MTVPADAQSVGHGRVGMLFALAFRVRVGCLVVAIAVISSVVVATSSGLAGLRTLPSKVARLSAIEAETGITTVVSICSRSSISRSKFWARFGGLECQLIFRLFTFLRK